ncbi:MAG: MFS transporter [Promethearchaeota archaeon]
MSEKLNRRVLFSLILMCLAGQIAWAIENQYYNVYLYNVIAPQPIYISVIVSVTAVVAALTTILMGNWSDTIGRRKPFLIVGFACWSVTTAIFPLAAIFHPVIVAVAMATLFDSLMTFFGSTAYDATFNAYVTDVTTVENRGRVSSIIEIVTLLSVLLVYGGAGIAIDTLGFEAFFYLSGIVVGVLGVIGAVMAPPPKIKRLKKSYIENLKSTFNKASLRENKDIFLVLLSSSIWGIAFNVYFPYVLIYIEHHLKFTGFLPSLIFAVAFLIAIIAAMPIGMLVDKVGRKKIIYLSIILEFIGLVLFSFSDNLISVVLSGSLFVFAMMMFDIAQQALIKDLYPEDKRGQFSGYFILFNVLIAMTIGSLIGGFYSQNFGIPYTSPDGIPGYIPPPSIFILSAIIVLPSIIPLLKTRETLSKTNSISK